MWTKKKEEKTYCQRELDHYVEQAREQGYNRGRGDGAASAVWEGRTIDECWARLRDRKKTFALKMVDAIARGTVEELLKEWDNPYADDWK